MTGSISLRSRSGLKAMIESRRRDSRRRSRGEVALDQAKSTRGASSARRRRLGRMRASPPPRFRAIDPLVLDPLPQAREWMEGCRSRRRFPRPYRELESSKISPPPPRQAIAAGLRGAPVPSLPRLAPRRERGKSATNADRLRQLPSRAPCTTRWQERTFFAPRLALHVVRAPAS